MFPESPHGRHFAWLWELTRAGGSGLSAEDLGEHFSELAQSFPFVDTAALKGFAQNSFMVGAELRSLVEEGGDRLVAAITTPSGLRLETCVSFPKVDHRTTHQR
jgi:hypothetical protein